MHVVTYTGLIAMFAYVSIQFAKLPAEIPAHYNFEGEVTRIGSKVELWILPIIVTVLVVPISFLCKFPHTFNYPLKITEENVEKVYTDGRLMMASMNLLIVALFFVLVIKVIHDTRNPNNQMSSWWTNILLIGIFIDLFYFIFRILRHKVD